MVIAMNLQRKVPREYAHKEIVGRRKPTRKWGRQECQRWAFPVIEGFQREFLSRKNDEGKSRHESPLFVPNSHPLEGIREPDLRELA
jgi:hypothetical protein